MPRWICPNCSAIMQVKESLLGQIRPCVKCGLEGELKDSDETLSRPTSRPNQMQIADEKLVKEITALVAEPGSISVLARVLSIIIPVGALFWGFCLQGSGSSRESGDLLSFMAMAGAFQAVLVWPIYTMTDDTRANRKLLERIAAILDKPAT